MKLRLPPRPVAAPVAPVAPAVPIVAPTATAPVGPLRLRLPGRIATTPAPTHVAPPVGPVALDPDLARAARDVARAVVERAPDPAPTIDDAAGSSAPAVAPVTPAPAAPGPTWLDDGVAVWTPDAIADALRWLEPLERMELLGAIDGTAPPLTFRAWIADVNPDYEFHTYAEKLIRVLQDVADGVRLRVMVFMPPQLGKSELVSRLFAAYWLYRHPRTYVGLASYAAGLAHKLSRAARANFVKGGGELDPGSRSVKEWHTATGGGLWAVGAGGSAAGSGYSLGILDDPIKDAKEAKSDVVREGRNEWYDSVFWHRKAPRAAIIVLLTRWHLHDIAGHLLAREEAAPERWHVVRFRAIADAPRRMRATDDPSWGRAGRPAELDDPDRLPSTTTEEPDWRAPGEGICEARKPLRDLVQIRTALGGDDGYYWNAVFQQRPVPLGGGMIKANKITRLPRSQVPPYSMLRLVRGWDFGASTDGDPTAGLLIGRGHPRTAWAGKTIILGLVHGQWEPAERDAMIRATVKNDGPMVHQRAPQDPAQAGKTHAAHFAALVRGYSFSIIPVSANKEISAIPLASEVNIGAYYIVDEPWATVVLTEWASFGPAATHDDITDAGSIAHNYAAAMERADDVIAQERGDTASVAMGSHVARPAGAASGGDGAGSAYSPAPVVSGAARDAVAYITHRR